MFPTTAVAPVLVTVLPDSTAIVAVTPMLTNLGLGYEPGIVGLGLGFKVGLPLGFKDGLTLGATVSPALDGARVGAKTGCCKRIFGWLDG